MGMTDTLTSSTGANDLGVVNSDNLKQEMDSLRRLLELGDTLHYSRDQQYILDAILHQARHMAGAEAASLLLTRNEKLRFVAVLNGRPGALDAAGELMNTEIPLTDDSLAAFVARTGEITNVPDSYSLPDGTPFRVCRKLDSCTGYKTVSILAVPLTCPDGQCMGVLQLFNHLDDAGHVEPFPTDSTSALGLLASSSAISIHNMALQEQLRQAHLEAIFRLSMVAEYRNGDTSQHVRRVSRTCGILATAMGLPAHRATILEYASPMHDIGMVSIPDSIILRPGSLTTDQRSAMEKHTVIGADILSDATDEMTIVAREIALRHHERWDGLGYPTGLSGHAIALAARMVALADSFGAIVSHRCYKNACSLDTAMDIIQGDREKHFDPDVVDAFVASLDTIAQAYPTLYAA